MSKLNNQGSGTQPLSPTKGSKRSLRKTKRAHITDKAGFSMSLSRRVRRAQGRLNGRERKFVPYGDENQRQTRMHPGSMKNF